MGPEQRPGQRQGRDDARDAGDVGRGVVVDQVAGRRHSQKRQHEQGLDAEQGDRAPARRPAGGVLPDEDPQGPRHRHDTDEFQARPELRRGHGVGGELDGVAGRPEEDPQQHHGKAGPAGGGPTAPDEPEHPQVGGPAHRETQAECQFPRHHDSRPPPTRAGGAPTVTSPRRSDHPLTGGMRTTSTGTRSRTCVCACNPSIHPETALMWHGGPGASLQSPRPSLSCHVQMQTSLPSTSARIQNDRAAASLTSTPPAASAAWTLAGASSWATVRSRWILLR